MGCSNDSNKDEILVQRIKTGDESAETELVKKYRTYVYDIFYKILKNPEDAEDKAQELWEYLLRRGGLTKWKPTGLFKAWLYRVVLNRARDYLRKRRWLREREKEYQPPLIERVTPESEVMDKETYEIIISALDSLPINEKRSFEMRWLYGASYQTIADTLGISIGYVGASIHRARKKLLEALSEFSETS